MKKGLALVLTLAMVICLLSGCSAGAETGASAASEAAAESAIESSESAEPEAPAPEAQAEEASETEEPAESSAEEEAEETAAWDGSVIPAEECQAKGYDVPHGMFDYETYVELPLTEGDTLSYWMMIQPFMMGYNDFDINEVTFFREMEARTGVHLDITSVGAFSAMEQFGLMVASGAYTDLIEDATSNYSGGDTQLIADEIVIDLLPYEDLMPNFMAKLKLDPKVYVSALTVDGSLASASGFTSMERNVGPQLRGDWLEALELDVPVTYDDYHDVLTAFKNNYDAGLWLDSNGTLRFMCFSAGYDTILNEQRDDSLIYVDGTAEYTPATEDYRDYLRLMNSWWNEGLIYQDFLSQTAISTPDSSLVANGKIGVWATDCSTMVTYDSLSDEIDVACTPFPVQYEGQTFKLYSTQDGAGAGTNITTSCSNIELACRWLDYLYTYEGYLLTTFGVEGEGLQFDADGNPGFTDLVLHNPDGKIIVACSILYAKYGGAGIIDVDRFNAGYSEKQLAALETWNSNLGDGEYTAPGAIQYSTEEAEAYAALFADISTYATQCSLSFLTGDMSLEDDWDTYLANLEQLGLSDWLEVCQSAYDRYSERVAEAVSE